MVETAPAPRKLAAILAADIADYSRLMEADGEGTLARLKTLRREVIDTAIAGHHGRVVKTTGDGLLVEFSSIVPGAAAARTEIAGEPSGGRGADDRGLAEGRTARLIARAAQFGSGQAEFGRDRLQAPVARP